MSYPEITAAQSETLLQFIRNPDALIESVKESITLKDRAILAVTDIRFSENRLTQAHLAYRYVDILHPDKGLAIHISLETEGAELASHHEHMAIARDAIGYRFASIVDKLTIKTHVSTEILQELERALSSVRADLTEIPSLPPSRALSKLRLHFGADGTPLWLSRLRSIPGVEHAYCQDDESIDALYRLCKRLARKYLLLVRVPTKGPASRQLRFTVERPYSTMSTKDNKPATKRRHVFFGSSPTAFRYHTPWAKRTAHYSFTARAPHGQFFSQADVVSRATEGPDDTTNVVLDHREPVPFSWAVSLDQGDRVNFFVGHGRSWTQPIFISLTHRELPGRSLLRATALTMTALLLMGAFFILAVGYHARIGDGMAAILALLALGGVASPWPRDPGPLGIPILSRIIPVLVAGISCVFIVWILTHRSWSTALSIPDGTLWGFLCLLAMLAILARLTYRIFRQGRDYRKAINHRPITGGALY